MHGEAPTRGLLAAFAGLELLIVVVLVAAAASRWVWDFRVSWVWDFGGFMTTTRVRKISPCPKPTKLCTLNPKFSPRSPEPP